MAAEDHVALVDLNAMSAVLYEALGSDVKKAFAGEDTTHHSNYGAYELAQCVLTRLSAIPEFRPFLAHSATFDPAHPDPPATFAVPADVAPVAAAKPLGN